MNAPHRIAVEYEKPSSFNVCSTEQVWASVPAEPNPSAREELIASIIAQ